MSKEIGISLHLVLRLSHTFERISLGWRIYNGNKRNKPSAKRS
jgi:hypothetical protein